MKYLIHLHNLRKLDISDTDITKAGMEYLVHLVNLKMLVLTSKMVNGQWSSSHQPKEHPLTRLLAAGCFVHLGISFYADSSDDMVSDDTDITDDEYMVSDGTYITDDEDYQ